jgi:hypothetical protein
LTPALFSTTVLADDVATTAQFYVQHFGFDTRPRRHACRRRTGHDPGPGLAPGERPGGRVTGGPDPRPRAPVGTVAAERRPYTNSRVIEALASEGYVVNARFIARRGAWVCNVTVHENDAVAPALTPEQEAAGLSVLTALCDL